ncbi:MAG: TIGR02266 family protein [Candidatus Methylomirabilota bacterium]|jgi:uncharacterized protein (TIGR02266 family)
MASRCVLIGDDDPLARLMMRDALAELSITILEARDGKEALRLAKAEGPHLIILDVMMPELDGFQVATLLKQDPTTAQIPVIFVSALGAARDKVRGLNLGAEDYLAKPIHAEELRARVQMVLRRVQPSQREVPLASGQLEAMNVLSLVQLFEGERRTARLLLAREDARGEIAFEEGRIIRAAQGTRKGKAAVYQLLTWQKGTFQMAPADPSGQVGGTVDGLTQALLIEGLRRLDEIPRLHEGLRNPPIHLELSASLRAAIQAQAQPESAAVIALLDGTRDLEQVLAQSPLDDWATLRVIDALRRASALGPADVSQDRRGGPRLYVEVPIEYQSLRSFQQSAAFNLSARGVFIRTAVPFDMGEQVVLRFLLPGQEAPVTVIGQVVWRNADPSKAGGMGMGIRFVETAADDRDSIERHLAQAIAEQVSSAEQRQ